MPWSFNKTRNFFLWPLHDIRKSREENKLKTFIPWDENSVLDQIKKEEKKFRKKNRFQENSEIGFFPYQHFMISDNLEKKTSSRFLHHVMKILFLIKLKKKKENSERKIDFNKIQKSAFFFLWTLHNIRRSREENKVKMFTPRDKILFLIKLKKEKIKFRKKNKKIQKSAFFLMNTSWYPRDSFNQSSRTSKLVI